MRHYGPAREAANLTQSRRRSPAIIRFRFARRIFVKKLIFALPLMLAMLAIAPRAQAKLRGCTDSPENPTVVLGLVVGVAGAGTAQIRKRFAKGKKTDQQ
jgi:XrtJ-associated TM-motif-TM protein